MQNPVTETSCTSTTSTFTPTPPASMSSFFVPLATQWQTDTLNLDSLAGHAPMTIRFHAKSGYGNELYIDNINIHANATGIDEQLFRSARHPVANRYPQPRFARRARADDDSLPCKIRLRK